MRDWTLSQIVWVADRGFSSEHNRRYLRQGDHAYIIGEKLRSDSPGDQGRAVAAGPLHRHRREHAGQGSEGVRHRAVRDLPQPRRRHRDAHIREQLVAQLEELIAGSDTLPAMKRGELRGKISTKPGLNRYLRVTPGGLLRIDKAKIKTEANLDGKYLLRCSDPHLSAADIALGYKQLLEVERGWRDMKQILDLRPVYHRLEERIRAHVLLCWLALLLIRIIETTTGRHLAPRAPRPRPAPRRHLHRPHRHLPPAHRADQAPTRPARRARHPHPKKIIELARKPLTSGTTPRLETRLRRVSRRVPAGQTQDHGL